MKKQIDGVKWQSTSNLPDAKNKKQALFFLQPVEHENKISLYFVNNSGEKLDFICAYEPMAHRKHNFGKEIVPSKTTLTEDDLVYEDVLPNQGIRIASQDAMCGSDFIDQFIIYTYIKNPDEQWGLWRFSVIEKTNISKPYPLLWDDFQVPSKVIAKKINNPSERPILPLVVNTRYAKLQELKQKHTPEVANFIIAVHDCIYRHDDPWPVGCYANDLWDEYFYESLAIANRLLKNEVNSTKEVTNIITAVFDEWLWEECMKDRTGLDAVAIEILQLYQDFQYRFSS